jgi:hypothetical protein
MVTEKYLLSSQAEWRARQEAMRVLDEILLALKNSDVPAVGAATTRNFAGPIQTIIPWASNYYTETLIEKVRKEFDQHFWGFWMLGGMSGGGMGFIFAPERREVAQQRLAEMMLETKSDLEHALPFAMDPVVYDFAINQVGTCATLLQDEESLLPPAYYALVAPGWLRTDARKLSPLRRAELDKFGMACRLRAELRGMVQTLFDRLLPPVEERRDGQESLSTLLERLGFDRAQHEQVQSDVGFAFWAHWTRPKSAPGKHGSRGRRTRGRHRCNPAAFSRPGQSRPARAPGRGRCRGQPGRRRWKPMDSGGRHRQGTAPVLQARWQTPQLCRGPPG